MDKMCKVCRILCVVWEWAARTRIKPYSALGEEAKYGFNETEYI